MTQAPMQGTQPYVTETGATFNTTSGQAAALQQYDRAFQNARTSANAAAGQIPALQKAVTDMQATIAAAPPGTQSFYDNALKAATDQLTHAVAAYDTLLAQEQRAADSRADAYAKAAQDADPTLQALAQAKVQQAQTEAQQAAQQYEEWKGATEERKGAVAAQQRLVGLQADQAQLNTEYQRATQPQQRELLSQQIQANSAALQQAGLDIQTAQQIAPERITQAQQQTQGGSIANQTAQANLEELQRRARQNPTDDQAQQALQTALQQAQANLEGTQAQTTRANADIGMAQQGTLYGLDEFISAQKEAIAKGFITPQQADRTLQARIAGTDEFTASQAAETGQMNRYSGDLQQRGQDIGLTGQKVGAYTSMANQGLSQFSQMNNTAPPGSDAVGRGLLGWLGNAQTALSQFQPPPQIQAPQMPSFLQSFAGQGQQQSVPQGAGQVTINIGGGGSPQVQQAPQQNPFGSGGLGPIGAGQQGGTSSPMLEPYRPATPDDVMARWQQPQQADLSNTGPRQRGALY
jgi:hypothetical protein